MNIFKNLKMVGFACVALLLNGLVAQAGPGGGGDTDARLTALENDVAALQGQSGTLGDDVAALGSDVGSLGSEVDALGSQISALGGASDASVRRLAAQQRLSTAQSMALIEQNRVNIERLNRDIRRVKSRAYSGVAAAAALDAFITPSGPNKTTLMAGVAHYEGESAVGVTATHQLGIKKLEEQRVFVNGGISFTSEETVLSRFLAGFEF